MKTKDLVFMGLYVALAIALDYFKEMLPFLNMANGGSINIALIPVVVASFHLGALKGMIVGALWWLVSSLLGLNNSILNVAQYLLDYVIPSVVIGAASIFYRKHTSLEALLGIALTMFIRTASIIISGAFFWPGDAAAGSLAAWVGSLSYNLPYSIATMVMLMIVVPLIMIRLKKAID